jgi:hypothetical protein
MLFALSAAILHNPEHRGLRLAAGEMSQTGGLAAILRSMWRVNRV